MNRGSTGHSSQNYTPTQHSANSYQQHPNRQQNGSFNPAQKRPHSTAFDNQSSGNHNATRSRPLAPPAVPSFGIDFDTLLPKKQEPPASTAQSAPPPTPKKSNLLGLTPAVKPANLDSDSESDAEEESKLATALSTNPNTLTFEHNGQPASLSTPEEIASWIAERRKKWPTEAKRETARQQAEERKRKYDAEKAARLEAGKAAAKARLVEREKQRVEREKSLVRQRLLREQILKSADKAKTKGKGSDGQDVAQSAAQIKADKLRRKAAKVAQKLKLAELALEKQTQGTSPELVRDEADEDNLQEGDDKVKENDIDTLLAQVDQIAAAQQNLDSNPTAPDANIDVNIDFDLDTDTDTDLTDDSAASIADDTSTSGSSNSDSDSDPDAPPDQLTSKDSSTLNSFKPPSSHIDTRPLCTNYTKTGRCKFGRRCRFKHEKPAALDRKSGSGGSGKDGGAGKRKGLYQVMVQKEIEEERRRVVRAIIALGEAGWFDEKGARNGE